MNGRRIMIKYFEINDKGNNIKCKLFCDDPQNIKTVIISCHGFAGSKESGAHKKIAETFIKKSKTTAVISFDWPCHGKDVKKSLSLTDCNDYMNSVVSFVQNSLGVNDIYLQATSFGGYLSLKYISENPNPFKKIALRCPAVNMYDVMTERILTDEDKKDLAKGRPVVSGFERKIKITPEFIKELQANDITQRDFSDFCGTVRIMQGTNDELVMFDDVKKFCDNNILDFDPIEGADHRYTNPAHLRACINIMEELYTPSEIDLGRGLN
jgi:esterase/lipase